MAYFRLGLVGAGRMGRTHLRALAESESVRLTAIAEPSAQQRPNLSGTAATVHATADAMLDAGNIDGVLIAAPTNLHLELVKQVLARGLPVLCEKPCGETPQQAGEAARLAAEARVPLQVAYWRRFDPSLRRLRDRIAAGEFGQIYLVTCYQWDAQPPDPAFRETSGGIFVDMGVHEFDQLRWLTNQELSELHSIHSDAWSGPPVAGHAESAQVLCKLSGGANGFVSLGQRFPAGDVCWAQAFGTRNAEECRFLWPPDAESAFLQALRAQAESFTRYARGGPLEGAEAADSVAALVGAQSASRVLGSRPEIP